MGLVRRRSVVLVAALAALFVLSLAASAAAEEIVYECADDLCLVDPDNPGLTPDFLTETDNAADNWESKPVWSPRGDLIAYIGLYAPTGNETWDIFTIDPNEAEPEATPVSQTSEFEEYEIPDWSPDGNLLAFTSRPHASDNPLKAQALVGRADGAALPVAIHSSPDNEGNPHFGPNSNTVAFIHEGTVWMGAADGSGTPAPSPLGAYGSDWSPDGRYLAGFRLNTYPYGLMLTATDGSGTHELPVPASLSSTVDWSCDSSRIAYVADEEPYDQIRVAPVDGSGPGAAIPLPEGWVSPHDPVFSPDGTKVAFDALPLVSGYTQIFVAPADGSAAPTQITKAALNALEPSWKPGPSCAAPVPPPVSPPATGTGTTPGAGGSSVIPATQAPVKIKLAYLKQPKLELPHFMTIAGIDCNAQGGHPTGEVAEICAANASAYARAQAPAGRRPWAKAKGATEVLFAKGQVKVPVGKSKQLKLKFTAAGEKLLKPGRTLTLTVKLVTKQGSAKPVKSTKTLKLKVPAKK